VKAGRRPALRLTSGAAVVCLPAADSLLDLCVDMLEQLEKPHGSKGTFFLLPLLSSGIMEENLKA
jgi:hypothetical protein